MLSIELTPDIQRRLSALAEKTGRAEDAYARELIEEHMDDLEDRYLAELRLSRGVDALSSQQVRKELGLEN